jgi:hypothetical protein
MASGEDFIFRPILAGLCKFEAVKEKAIDLYDLARMNEALDIDAENKRRVREDK